MAKLKRQILAIAAISLLLLPLSFAEIIVSKAGNKNLNVGDSLNITLIIKNTYNEDIKVKISDSNIIANNGISIKCLEQIIPANNQVEIPYPAIHLFKPGNFTLSKAEASYTYHGKNYKAESNLINISISGTENPNIQVQGITEIYKCNGINSQSTRIVSSTGGTSFSFSSSNNGIQINTNLGGRLPNFNFQNPGNKANNEPSESDLVYKGIKRDPKFKAEESKLNARGFILQRRLLNKTSDGYQFIYLFKNRDKWRYIKGFYKGANESGTVSNITSKEIGNHFPAYILLIILLAGIIATYIFAYPKKTKEPKLPEISDLKQPVHKAKEELLDAFDINNPKEAFKELNKRLRNYIKDKISLKGAFTDKELSNKIMASEFKSKSAVANLFKEVIGITEEARFANSYTKQKLEKLKNLIDKIIQRIEK